MLLLSWDEDDSALRQSISDLGQTFRDLYKFAVKECRIPSDSTRYMKIIKEVESFVGDGRKGGLLIMYYGGNARRSFSGDPVWMSSYVSPEFKSLSNNLV